MLYRLFCDMLDMLRLRFHSADHYHYSPMVIFAVLLLLGLLNAAGMSALFGSGSGVMAYSMAVTALRLILLAIVMGKVLHFYGAPQTNWFGYVLASETLIVPQLLLINVPALAMVSVVWQVWTVIVQLVGFMKISGRSGWQVLIGLLAYGVTLVVFGTLLTLVFNAAGVLDYDTIQQQFNQIFMQQQAN